MAKPILLVSIPYLDKEETLSIKESLIEFIKDYHIIVYATSKVDDGDIQFKIISE